MIGVSDCANLWLKSITVKPMISLLMLQKVIATLQAWNALWNQYFALPDRYSEMQLLFATSVDPTALRTKT